jgi:membrane-anchored protein YejM (alkaline phosphatase superfamily)
MRKKKSWNSWIHEHYKQRAKEAPNGDCTLAIFMSDEFQKPVYDSSLQIEIGILKKNIERQKDSVQSDMNHIAKLYRNVDHKMIDIKKMRIAIQDMESQIAIGMRLPGE